MKHFMTNQQKKWPPTKQLTKPTKIYHQLGNTQGIAVPRTLLEMFQRLQSFCLFMGARLKLLYRSWHIKLLISSLCVSDNFFLMFPCVFISFSAAGNMQGKKGGKLNPVLPCMIIDMIPTIDPIRSNTPTTRFNIFHLSLIHVYNFNLHVRDQYNFMLLKYLYLKFKNMKARTFQNLISF